MPRKAAGYVVLTLGFRREGSKSVGTCIELGTSTFARTLRQCQQELEELVAEHLSALESVGEIERFLKQWGITLYQGDATPGVICIPADWIQWPGPQEQGEGLLFAPRRFRVGKAPESRRALATA